MAYVDYIYIYIYIYIHTHTHTYMYTLFLWKNPNWYINQIHIPWRCSRSALLLNTWMMQTVVGSMVTLHLWPYGDSCMTSWRRKQLEPGLQMGQHSISKYKTKMGGIYITADTFTGEKEHFSSGWNKQGTWLGVEKVAQSETVYWIHKTLGSGQWLDHPIGSLEGKGLEDQRQGDLMQRPWTDTWEHAKCEDFCIIC